VKHLQIIDEETGAELAELGMTTRERTRACMDCRFRVSQWAALGTNDWDICGARGNRCIRTERLNQNGDCSLWEPKNKIAKRDRTTIVKTHPLVKIWAWTSLVAILWLLLRGGL
jgi:hypothetical protein